MSAEYILVNELLKLRNECRKILLVDVREPNEFKQRHIQNAINIPSQEFEEAEYGEIKMLCKLRRYLCAGYTIILYCELGNTSLICANKLNSLGISAMSLYGGMEYYFKTNNKKTVLR